MIYNYTRSLFFITHIKTMHQCLNANQCKSTHFCQVQQQQNVIKIHCYIYAYIALEALFATMRYIN